MILMCFFVTVFKFTFQLLGLTGLWSKVLTKQDMFERLQWKQSQDQLQKREQIGAYRGRNRALNMQAPSISLFILFVPSSTPVCYF